MTRLPVRMARLEAETAYEAGMIIAAGFHAAGLLDRAELEAFQTVLAGDTEPVTGRLDEGVQDWIKTAL